MKNPDYATTEVLSRSNRSPDIAEEGGDVGDFLRADQYAPALAEGVFEFAGDDGDVAGDDQGAMVHALGGLHLAESFGYAVAGKFSCGPDGQRAQSLGVHHGEMTGQAGGFEFRGDGEVGERSR